MFIGINCFIPNGLLESLGWIYKVAMINLGLTDSIYHMQCAISDQEQALYKPLDNLSKVESLYCRLYVSICTYHLFDQSWLNKLLELVLT